MRPIKIVHFADVHLGMENYGKLDPKTGLNSRLGDFCKSLDAIVDFSVKNKVDLAVFCGDAYKTRDPSPTYQREFAKRIYAFAKADIPIVMVVGNHDFPNALGKADTLDIFPTLAVPNIYIFQKDDLKIINTKSGPIQIAGLPWFTRNQLLDKKELAQKKAMDLNLAATKKLVEKINYLSSRINPKLPSILAAHASVEKALFGSERQVIMGSELTIPLEALRHSNFNCILLGHLHKAQTIPVSGPPIVYSGSIERIDFGEEKEDKGFVLATINFKNGKYLTQIDFQKLAARPFISIRVCIKPNDDNPTETVIEKIKKYKIDNAVVKVIIEIDEEKSNEIREGAIREALAKANFIAGINKAIKKEERVKLAKGFSDEFANLDHLGMLEKYFQSRKVSKSRIEILKKETEKLLEDVFV